jgi:type IV secretion system protein VirD4
MKNYAGHRLSPWLGHLMVSRTETARALLTQGEIMQLPETDEIVLLAGAHPIRAKKARYYADPRLSKRIERPPSPEPREPAGDQGDWQDRITAALEPPARPDTAAFDEQDAETEGGVRREPELLEHEDIAPAPRPSRNEFEFEDRHADEDASRNRRLAEQIRANARRAALDPGDGIEL